MGIYDIPAGQGRNSVGCPLSAAPTLIGIPTRTPIPSRASSRKQQHRSQPVHAASLRLGGSSTSKITAYLTQQVRKEYLSVILIVCAFASGMVDAVAFNSWNCFVGMQTGNTIFAALGISGQPQASHEQNFLKAVVSISSFIFGTLAFHCASRFPTGLSNMPTSRSRALLTGSFLTQSCFIVAAGILVQSGLVSSRPYIGGSFSSGSHDSQNDSDLNVIYLDLLPIGLLAFQAAGQVTFSRVLDIIELPTIVLSTLYHDFTASLYSTLLLWRSSESLWDFLVHKARRQEKRLCCIIAFFLGALGGGLMFKSVIGLAGALFIVAGIKFAVSVALLVWPAVSESEVDEETVTRKKSSEQSNDHKNLSTTKETKSAR